MKVMIDIPKEFEEDLKGNFKELFERLIADIDFALEKQEPLLCGNYERETAEMFLSAFEKATVIPDNATNGDMIKAMFPNVDKYHNMLLENHSKNILFSDDWWNAPYKKGVGE